MLLSINFLLNTLANVPAPVDFGLFYFFFFILPGTLAVITFACSVISMVFLIDFA